MAANARDPLQIFPAEIWEIILEQLRKEEGSSRDIFNCSKVCTEFERILEPTNQEWLFESICPFILPYLKGGELLACRKICKNWRRGVDNFLEDSETWRPFNEETSDVSRSSKYDLRKQKKTKWTTKIRGNHGLGNFLSAMKKQEMKTRFVGRSLALRNLNPVSGRVGKGFFKKALEVFRLYGDHLWHLFVIPEDLSVFDFYHSLKSMLDFMPNLKYLTLFIGYDYRKLNKPDLDLLDLYPVQTVSLETLEIFTFGLSPLIILRKLSLRINLGNLKCLKLKNFKSRKVNPTETFVVVGRRPSCIFHLSICHWDYLKQIFDYVICPYAPLTKLCLSFAVDKEIDFDGVCDLISTWKSTLRMLVIKGIMNSFSRKPGISLTKLEFPI